MRRNAPDAEAVMTSVPKQLKFGKLIPLHIYWT